MHVIVISSGFMVILWRKTQVKDFANDDDDDVFSEAVTSTPLVRSARAALSLSLYFH